MINANFIHFSGAWSRDICYEIIMAAGEKKEKKEYIGGKMKKGKEYTGGKMKKGKEKLRKNNIKTGIKALKMHLFE